MTNTLGITLDIINNYPWTRLSVRIIGAIKRQFFTWFDNSNQEIFAINTWGALIYSLGHGHKHMLAILPTILMETRLKSSQSKKFEFNVFSIIHLNGHNF